MYWKPTPDLYPPYLRQWIRRGKGVRKHSEYRSWLTVRDVPSRGTSAKVAGIRVNRSYNLLSELETTYFFLLERKGSVVDIRENWPILDIDRTLELCSSLGVQHQYRGRFPAPFTIDFLITELVDGVLQHRAASIKTPSDAASPKVRQRLAVEYFWCRARGIPWTLVDTSEFDRVVLATLRFMRTWFRHRYAPNEKVEVEFTERFLAAYARNVPLGELIDSAANSLRLPDLLAKDTFRYCAWTDRIAVSLTHPLSFDMPLVLRRAQNHA